MSHSQALTTSPLRFSVGRMVEHLPGQLSTQQWVMLAGAVSLALASGRAPSDPSPAGVRDWLENSSFPAEAMPLSWPSAAEAWRAVMMHVLLEVPESELTVGALRALITELHADLLQGRQKDIAGELLQAWFATSDSKEDAPLLEIAELMIALTLTRTGDRVHCTGQGCESAAVACLRSDRIPVVDSGAPPTIALIYALLMDLQVDLTSDARNDVALARILVPHRSSADASPKHADALKVAMLERAARVVVLVPNRILFARNAWEFRRSLVESHRLRGIIGFPQGALTASASPFSIVWFDRMPDDAAGTTFVKVVDDIHFDFARGQLRTRASTFTGAPDIVSALMYPPAQSSWCRHVPHEEIAKNDYSLTADRYLGTEVQLAVKHAAKDRFLVTLADVATVIKAQTFRSCEGEGGVLVGEVSPGEFPQYGYLESAVRQRQVNPQDYARFKEQVMMGNDLLLSTKGTIGRTAIAAPREGSIPMLPSPSTVILRLHNNRRLVDPIVLLMYLRSPLFQSLLRSVVVGTTIPNVSLFDLRKLSVVVPRLDEQKALRRAFQEQGRLQLEVQRLQQQQANEAKDAWKALDLWMAEANS